MIMPQAARIAVPPSVGFLVQLLKGTSLASVIGFTELTWTGQMINNVTFQPLYRVRHGRRASTSRCAGRCRCSAPAGTAPAAPLTGYRLLPNFSQQYAARRIAASYSLCILDASRAGTYRPNTLEETPCCEGHSWLAPPLLRVSPQTAPTPSRRRFRCGTSSISRPT